MAVKKPENMLTLAAEKVPAELWNYECSMSSQEFLGYWKQVYGSF